VEDGIIPTVIGGQVGWVATQIKAFVTASKHAVIIIKPLLHKSLFVCTCSKTPHPVESVLS